MRKLGEKEVQRLLKALRLLDYSPLNSAHQCPAISLSHDDKLFKQRIWYYTSKNPLTFDISPWRFETMGTP